MASAEMAAKWEQFAEDGDEYNLQYRTVGDDHVRPEHAALHGVTLPMSDPFWQEYYPPNGWNCRCSVTQVRKSKYPVTDHNEAMERGAQALQRDKKGMFHFNPGIEGKTFPDYNPYTISRCRDCDIAKGKGKFARITPADNELCGACQYIRTCESNRSETITIGTGTIEISNLVNRNDSDFSRLYQVAEHFAIQGERVLITPKLTRPPQFDYDCIYGSLKGTPYYGKCPDLKVGNSWYEHEGFVTDNPKRAFSNMINHGLKQSDRIIIDRPELTERFMLRSIGNRIKQGVSITEVWLRDNDGSLKLLFKKTDG